MPHNLVDNIGVVDLFLLFVRLSVRTSLLLAGPVVLSDGSSSTWRLETVLRGGLVDGSCVLQTVSHNP